MRFEIPLPANVVARWGGFALSPDGGKLAFIGVGTDGQTRLWVRSLDKLVARPLDGTEGAGDWPFWSPDGRFIVFFAGGKLKKIEISGGAAVTLCDTPDLWGGAWSADGKIVFGSPTGTQQVSADGGPPLRITARGNSNTPSFLPDGRHFVYLDDMGVGHSETAIYVGSVDTRPQDQRFKKLLSDYTLVSYAPSPDPSVGYLLFVRGVAGAGAVGTLMAQRFDTRRLELGGDAVEVAEHVSNLNFSASEDVLVYVTGAGIQSRLTWFDRQGKPLGNVGDPGFYGNVAISPDGERVAFDLADPRNPGEVANIWLYDFARELTTRFAYFEKGRSNYPVWSRDGSRIAFASNREGQFDLYEKSSNLAGEEELLFKSAGQNKFPSSWSPDGRFLSYFTSNPSGRLWVLSTSAGMDGKPTLVERSDYNQSDAQFSPDGRWIAYLSDESGRSEIYVRSFDESSPDGKPAATASGAGHLILSKNGGTSPRWRRDSRELFYLSPDGSAMAVDVTASGVFHAGIPRVLFKVPQGTRFWDVSEDGSRFLIAVPSGESSSAPAPFTVVSNWQAALKK
jgi:Tol biopolymer transport system component